MTHDEIERWLNESLALGPERSLVLLNANYRTMPKFTPCAELHYRRTGLLDASDRLVTLESPRIAFQLSDLIDHEFIRGEEDLARHVRHMLHKAACHEEDEWLRVDGKLAFDPHRSGR